MTLVKRILAFAIKKNFIYLISAFFVLLGCMLLMNGPSMATGSVFGKTLILLGVIQIYELLLALVGYSVYKRMGIDHDGLMLALISLLLLFDPTFFNNRIYMCAQSLFVGWGVNVVLFLAAMFKLCVIVHHTKIPFTPRFTKTLIATAAYIYLSPALLHSCPTAYRHILHFTMLAAIPLVPIALTRPRRDDEGKCSDRPWSNLHYRFEKYAFFLPLCLLPLHLYELGMIYTLDSLQSFFPWIMLALGATVMKVWGSYGRNPWLHIGVAWSACAAASYICYSHPSMMVFGDAFTPLRIVLAASSLYLLLSWSHTSDNSCLWHASLFSVLIAAGGTTTTIINSVYTLQPLWIFVLFLHLFTRAILSDEMSLQLGSAVTGALFCCRMLPLSTANTYYLFFQLTGTFCLLAFHRQGEDYVPKWLSSSITCLLVGMTGYWFTYSPSSTMVFGIILHLQIAVCYGLWLNKDLTWTRAAALCGSARFHAYPILAGQGARACSLLSQYSGFLSLAIAFTLLLLGFYVSVNKEKILESIEAVE